MGRAIVTQRCRDNTPGLIEAFLQRNWFGRHHGYGATATASTTTPLVLDGAAPPNASSETTNTERHAAPNLLGSSATPNDDGTNENDGDDVEDATTTDTMLDVFSKYQPNEAMTLYVLITGYLQGGDHETPYLWAAYGLCQILAPIFYAHTAGPDLQYYQLFGTSVYFCLWSIILGGPFLTLASYDHVKKIITAFVIPILSTLLTVYKDPIDTICGNSVNKEDASHRAPN